jgi:hypothetical protein
VHDWTLVEAGIFHDFHLAWIAEIRKVLNGGLLPKGYYALAEQHAGKVIPDILTLHAGPPNGGASPAPTGGIAVAEAPPKTRRRQTIEATSLAMRRTISIRHVSGHRLVALLEILSPANKDREQNVADFATKAADALHAGIHVLVVDLFPPGPHDPAGIHGVIWEQLERSNRAYDLPADEPLTLASYVAATPVEAYLEHLSIGAKLPEMPVFLHPDRYINTPLESTYDAAWRGVPGVYRDVLERPAKP